MRGFTIFMEGDMRGKISRTSLLPGLTLSYGPRSSLRSRRLVPRNRVSCWVGSSSWSWWSACRLGCSLLDSSACWSSSLTLTLCQQSQWPWRFWGNTWAARRRYFPPCWFLCRQSSRYPQTRGWFCWRLFKRFRWPVFQFFGHIHPASRRSSFWVFPHAIRLFVRCWVPLWAW